MCTIKTINISKRRIFFLAFMLLLTINLVISSSATANTIIKNNNNEIMIFKRIQPNNKSIIIGNQLLNNELYVNSIWPAHKFNGSLTWKENPYNDSTWCFYFHSLDMVGYLMNAYELNPSIKYLEKAKWYINSWMLSNPSPEKQASTFAWDDHSTANRVVNIVYFWKHYKQSGIYDKEFEDKLIALLEKHGAYLADDRHYSKGNNHGIFQDRSLLELALLLPNSKNSSNWYVKAMNRLSDHVRNDVTESGVHKEHSPSYHVIVLNLFKGIDQFLSQFGKNEKVLKDSLVKMEDYVAYLAKPDGTLPILGDSAPDNISSLNEDKITSSKLRYVLSKGLKGDIPNQDSIYKDAGVAIFRKGWNINNPMYLLFTAAYHSNVHKHADDLSFILSYGKTDFFVDSGKYNYNEKDAYRQYFRSSLAHNTITVDNNSYPLTKNQINKSKIEKYKSAGYYSYIVGSHTLYEDVYIKRTIIYLKNINSIMIHDVMKSNKSHTYTETFNIGQDVFIHSTDNKTFILKSTTENKQLEFKHLTKAKTIQSIKGSSNPIGGWQSNSFNKKSPISQLKFTNTLKNQDSKFVINTHSSVGIKDYSVKSYSTYDLYTIVYKDGKRGNIKIIK
ncbi:alginate lyase family protein [Fictibacillus nanhaiensis]|uniref:Alginate lyase family protein n=1 Tax=Fictibacillus nanhaiensis TaxID=742169 RepID=A0ABS2ZPN2_9BACL|nr:alginate lyase family protein [Fictibacillus nanhaiensis]